MIGSELRAELETKLGSRVVEASSLPVGFGLTGLRIALADGRRLAVKASQAGESCGSHLELEAYMLDELARLSELPVPQVHYADADLLVMDFIETDGGGITESVRAPRRRADRKTACDQARAVRLCARHADRAVAPAEPGVVPLGALLPRSSPAVHGEGGAPRRAVCRCRCLPASSVWRGGSTNCSSSPPTRACCMAISGPATC